jgi:carbonic anhydrase
VQNVTKKNVSLTVQLVREQSSILNQMEQQQQIKIVGGLHDIESGQVEFFD